MGPIQGEKGSGASAQGGLKGGKKGNRRIFGGTSGVGEGKSLTMKELDRVVVGF